MSERTSPAAHSLYLEDVVVGETWRSASHLVTEADIAAFGVLTRDQHRLHTDAEFCRTRGFPGVIAHGLFGLSLMEGLKTELRLYDTTSIASLGWDKVRFRHPILAGDTLHLRFRFVSVRNSRQPDRGVVTEVLELVNGNGTVVIDGEHAGLLLRRPAVA